VKSGELIWQRRLPGGLCVIIEVWDDREEYKKCWPGAGRGLNEVIWTEQDFPILHVLHPSEGLITDPSYYYEELS